MKRTIFGKKEWHTALAYHLNGLEEAATSLAGHLRALGGQWDKGDEATREALVGIHVEIFQLRFHMKESRRPMDRLWRQFFAEKEQEPSTGSVGRKPPPPAVSRKKPAKNRRIGRIAARRKPA